MSAANGVGATWSAPCTGYRGPTPGSHEDVKDDINRFHAIDPIAPGAPCHLSVGVQWSEEFRYMRFVVTGLPVRAGYHTQMRIRLTLYLADGSYSTTKEEANAGSFTFKFTTDQKVATDQIRFRLEFQELPTEAVMPTRPVNIPRPNPSTESVEVVGRLL